MPRTIEIVVYKFEELSDEAKERAHEKWQERWQFSWSDEYMETMKEFCNHFPVELKGYQISTCSPSYADMKFTGDHDLAQLSGTRLMAKLYTGYSDAFLKGKYFSLWSKTEKSDNWPQTKLGRLKYCHSRVLMERKNCALTGFSADEDILEPIYNFLDKPDDTTFEELMESCFDSWCEAYKNDMEHSYSMEYFKDECEANEYEFDEHGNRA